MAADLSSAFNALSTAEFNPKVKFEDLEKGKKYFIEAFRWVEVKNPLFGDKGKRSHHAVVAVIDYGRPPKEGASGNSADIFLPRRFCGVLNKGKVSEYNEKPNLCLIYEGIGANREYVVRLVERE